MIEAYSIIYLNYIASFVVAVEGDVFCSAKSRLFFNNLQYHTNMHVFRLGGYTTSNILFHAINNYMYFST